MVYRPGYYDESVNQNEAELILAKNRDCSRLDFAKMHVIKIYPDGVKAVKCTEYQKEAR